MNDNVDRRVQYTSHFIRVRADVLQDEFRFLEMPGEVTIEGFRWTACSDITKEQVALILQCAVLEVFTDKDVKWLQVMLAKVPMIMDMHNRAIFGSRPFRMNGNWRGILSFQSPLDGVKWSSFPGKTRIRIDAVAP